MKPVEIIGKENVPDTGTLVLPSVLRHGDLVQLERLLGQRPLAYLVPHAKELPPGVQDHIARGEISTIYLTTDEESLPAVVEAVSGVIAGGGSVVFVPEDRVARPATLSVLTPETIAQVLSLGVPVNPLFVDHPRENCLVVEPPRSNPELVFSFGEVLEPGQASVPSFLEILFACSERSFSQRPLFSSNLAWAVIHGIKKHPHANVVDGLDGSELRYDKLLAAAIALSKVIKKETSKPRIGVVLPPGKGVLIANLAALIAGKTPVNLNFTAGPNAVESAMRQADLDRYLTADPFVRKMQTFPWPPNRQLIFLERTLPQIKSKVTLWFLVSKLLPAAALCQALGVPQKGGRDEALLLFTSGSSGEPKGVVLSHRNIISNVSQFSARLGLRLEDRILGCLPLFHSFGCTVTMWFPMMEGLSLVTYPSPVDSTKLAPLIEGHGVGLLVSTPTFLRGYMRRVKREQLAGVRYIVSGAEKLPRAFAEKFLERFGKEILEGYGLTETAPVSNTNLPDPEDRSGRGLEVIPAHQPGSVGQLVPGLAIRLVNPDTREPVPLDQTGIVMFKGANVFEGYLNQPGKTEDVLQDGWFRTGDMGRLDGFGFLYIEGRLSRFSKIGGEMVPHETVEAHINKALGLDQEEERKIAVVGVPDEQKGEQLVLLSTVAGETISQELIDLRYTLLDEGVPALWIPKKMLRIEDVPLLASGKLDIRKCEEIATRA